MSLVTTERYQIDLEYNETYAIVHLPYVHRLTKEVYLDILASSDDIQDFLKTMGFPTAFAAVPREDKLMQRLIDKLGFSFQADYDNLAVYAKDL